MVEIADIQDQESFQAWLIETSQSREACIWLYHRLNMRGVLGRWLALAYSASEAESSELIDLLRGMLVADYFAANPTAKAPYSIGGITRQEIWEARNAINEVCISAAISDSFLDDDGEPWHSIRSDCQALVDRPNLNELPSQELWDYGYNPDLDDAWHRVQVEYDEGVRSDEAGWSFWIAWYGRALAGEGQPWSLMEKIILQGHEIGDYNAFWTGTVAEVNARINEIVARHAERQTFNAEEVVFDPDTSRLRLEPLSDLPTDYLSEAHEKIAALISSLETDGTVGANRYPIDDVLHILRTTRDGYRGQPRLVFSACTRVLRRMNAKINNGDCPSPDVDPDVADIIGTVAEVTTTLLELDPKVQQAVDLEGQIKVVAPKSDEARTLSDAAQSLAEISQGVLKDELVQDAKIIIDPTQSEEDRRASLYPILGRLLRGEKALRPHITELSKAAKPYADAVKSIGVITGVPSVILIAIKMILGF